MGRVLVSPRARCRTRGCASWQHRARYQGHGRGGRGCSPLLAMLLASPSTGTVVQGSLPHSKPLACILEDKTFRFSDHCLFVLSQRMLGVPQPPRPMRVLPAAMAGAGREGNSLGNGHQELVFLHPIPGGDNPSGCRCSGCRGLPLPVSCSAGASLLGVSSRSPGAV